MVNVIPRAAPHSMVGRRIAWAPMHAMRCPAGGGGGGGGGRARGGGGGPRAPPPPPRARKTKRCQNNGPLGFSPRQTPLPSPLFPGRGGPDSCPPAFSFHSQSRATGLVDRPAFLPTPLLPSSCCPSRLNTARLTLTRAPPPPPPPHNTRQKTKNRRRQQTNQTGDRVGRFSGVGDCFVKTAREEGLGAFYKGFLPNFARLGSWNVIMFLTLEQVKKKLFQPAAAA